MVAGATAAEVAVGVAVGVAASPSEAPFPNQDPRLTTVGGVAGPVAAEVAGTALPEVASATPLNRRSARLTASALMPYVAARPS